MAQNELPLSTSDAKQPVKIRLGKDGLAAIEPKTVMQTWNETVVRLGDHPALYQKRPAKNENAADVDWTVWTWKEYRAKVDAFGRALLSVGLDRFDSVNIIGFNAPEWFFANYGTIAAGGVPAGVYTTNGPDACRYIAEHSDAKVVVCEGQKQLEKFLKISRNLPSLKALVVYGDDELPADATGLSTVPIYTFDDFLKLGSEEHQAALTERSNAWLPGETCTYIYTSGTTGAPKAVMVTNDNITWTVQAMVTATRRGYMDERDCMISYLPLSHVAAQMLDMHMPMTVGCRIYFAQPDALKGSLGATLKDVRPTAFFGVPRVWEKIYEKMQEVAKQSTGAKKLIATWAKSEAAAYWEAMEYDALKEFSFTRTAPVGYYMSQVILSQVHHALGFDRCEGFYVSAAPIEVKILKYFASLDIPIMELFGQSECTGPHSVNTYTAFKTGTVGRPLPGTETKIDAETGELCYRGRHIFAGYRGSEEQTKGAIDSEGWLHSGDIARIDNDDDPNIPKPSGFISITGRIKELIITAGGENVAPVLIENEIKAASIAISNAMVIGDRRKFLTVLLCLKVEADADGNPTNKLSGAALDVGKEIGSNATTTEEAAKDAKWKAYLDEAILAANERATSRAQKIGKWSLLSTDFSEKGGELTPTLKLKRSVAAEIHSKSIEAMYA